MKHHIVLAILSTLLIGTPLAHGVTYTAYHGWCQKGGQKVSLSGLQSTTTVQASYGSCTVQVNITGGGLATLYSDAGITPLSNPFTAQADGTVVFFASTSQNYDIVESGGTPTPGFASPYTQFNVSLGGGGGSGGGSPAGNTNDVQINSGSGTFLGTGGEFQWTPSAHRVNISGAGGLNVATGPIDFSGAAHTIPNFVGPTSVISGLTCGVGWTAIASDGDNGSNYYTCGNDNLFHPITGSGTVTIPGTQGVGLLNGGGSPAVIGYDTNIFADGNHFWNSLGLNLNGTAPFTLQGTCPPITPLSPSAASTMKFGTDLGCVPKISINGSTPATIGLQGAIDYTYLKEDSNGCLALTSATGDVGIARVNPGVLGVLNCLNSSSASRLNVYATFPSSTNNESVTLNYVTASMAYFIGADHGSGGGNYHPLYFGAAGSTSPQWGIQTRGPWTCLATNVYCDLGSITASQQIRDIWMSAIIAYNGSASTNAGYGPLYPVNVTGVQVGLVAKAAATNPVQAVTAGTGDTSGTLGIVIQVTAGTVSNAFIVAGGSAYVAPTCFINAPTNPSGVQATCTATQAAGVINSVTIGTNGSGYQSLSDAAIIIGDSVGTGAIVVPVVTATTGFTTIAQSGSSIVPLFDGAVTIRDRVAISTTNAGQLHDMGISCAAPIPENVQTYGCSEVTKATAGYWAMEVRNIPAAAINLIDIVPSATTCPTAAAIGATCDDTISLTPAEPDTTYVPLCVASTLTSGVPTVVNVNTIGSGSFHVKIGALTAAAAQVTNWRCTVRHP